ANPSSRGAGWTARRRKSFACASGRTSTVCGPFKRLLNLPGILKGQRMSQYHVATKEELDEATKRREGPTYANVLPVLDETGRQIAQGFGKEPEEAIAN